MLQMALVMPSGSIYINAGQNSFDYVLEKYDHSQYQFGMVSPDA
jgi:hypothetical protein